MQLYNVIITLKTHGFTIIRYKHFTIFDNCTIIILHLNVIGRYRRDLEEISRLPII